MGVIQWCSADDREACFAHATLGRVCFSFVFVLVALQDSFILLRSSKSLERPDCSFNYTYFTELTDYHGAHTLSADCSFIHGFFIGLTDAIRTDLRLTSEVVRLRLTVFAVMRLDLLRLDLHLTMTWIFDLLILLRLAKINLRFTKA
jgi:hypothetical protein